MLAILDIGFGAFKFIIAAALMVVVPILGIYLIVKVFQGAGYVIGGVFRLIGSVFGRVGAFVRGMCLDTLHTAGGALTFSVLGLLSLGNLLIGRPGSARHYARALEDEATSIGLSMYRLALGHPVRLLGLSALTDGLERRLPDRRRKGCCSRHVARHGRPGKVPQREENRQQDDSEEHDVHADPSAKDGVG